MTCTLIKRLLLWLALNILNVYAVPIHSVTHATNTVARLPFQKVRIVNDSNSNHSNTMLQERSYYGLTSIYNDNQVQYLVNIEIGTPSQTFVVIVDTGRYVNAIHKLVIVHLPTHVVATVQSFGSHR